MEAFKNNIKILGQDNIYCMDIFNISLFWNAKRVGTSKLGGWRLSSSSNSSSRWVPSLWITKLCTTVQLKINSTMHGMSSMSKYLRRLHLPFNMPNVHSILFLVADCTLLNFNSSFASLPVSLYGVMSPLKSYN